MTLPTDKVGDAGQRFEIAVLQLDEITEIGYGDSPASFNDAIVATPRWRPGNVGDVQVLIRDRRPEEGSIGMLLGMLKGPKVSAALRRAGCITPRLENVLRKELGQRRKP